MQRQRFLAEEALYHVVSAAGALSGQGYLDKVAALIVETWQVAAAFIIEVDRYDPTHRTLRSYAGQDLTLSTGSVVDSHGWLGGGQPEVHYRPGGPSRLAADDPMLRNTGIEAYLAIPLIAGDGSCVGYVGILDDRELSAGAATEAEAFLGVLAQRIAAELQRSQDERHLEDELAQLRRFAADASDGFLVWTDRPSMPGAEPEIAYVNAAMERLTGYTVREISESPLVALGDILRRAADAGSGPNGSQADNAHTVVVRKDGTPVRLRLSVTQRVKDDVGEVHEYECVLQEQPEGLFPGGPTSWPALGDVLDAVSIGAIALQSGAVPYMNKRAREMTGCRPDDVLKLGVVVGGPDTELRSTLADWTKRLSRSRASRAIVRATTRRAGERAIEIVSHSMQVEGQRAQLLTTEDVTERVRATEEAEQVAEFSRGVFAALPAYVAVIDRSGTIVTANDAWNRGVSRFVAQPISSRIKVRGNLLALARQAMNQGSTMAGEFLVGVGAVLSGTMPDFTQQVLLPAANEGSVWLLLNVTPMADGAVITANEITALKAEQQEIVDSEMRERTILTNLPDQLAKVTAEGRISELFAPTQKAHVVPLLPPNSVGRNVHDVLRGPEGASLLQSLKDAARGDRVVIAKLNISLDDVERQYETRVVPFAPNELLLFARDRTSEQWPATSHGVNTAHDGQRARIAPSNPYGLTFREAAVLQLMVHGAADKEIASQLGVSVFTVNKHVSKVLRKMDAPSRTEASTRALREGLLD